MAGLMPQLKPLATMIWAALKCTASSTVRVQHVQGAVQWLNAFARDDFGPVERRCKRGTGHYMTITFGGTLTGGGATLRAGVTNVKEANKHPLITYWHGKWSDTELRVLQVVRGEPSGQARLEAYTLLVSFWCWRKLLAEANGGLAIVGDALGVVYDALKLRSSDRILNAVMGELALVLAPMGKHLTGAHLWSERNSTCDALSRMSTASQLPPELETVKRTNRGPPQFKVLSGPIE